MPKKLPLTEPKLCLKCGKTIPHKKEETAQYTWGSSTPINVTIVETCPNCKHKIIQTYQQHTIGVV